jgi:hypothetical protein
VATSVAAGSCRQIGQRRAGLRGDTIGEAVVFVVGSETVMMPGLREVERA